EDYDTAYAGFRWPDEKQFNWALEWFDGVLATRAESQDRLALWIVDSATGGETKFSFAQLSRRSSQAANFLRGLGVCRGDRILLLLGNVAPLWEIMLGAMKLGAVVIPATTMLIGDELADRLVRGRVKHIVAAADQVQKFDGLGRAETVRIAVGEASESGEWRRYVPESCDAEFAPDGPTRSDDPLLLYFTSGTTAKPKLVLHTHRSYPAGHLSTMYWLGLRPADIHLNVSSPGWAKHAWSCFFAPWNAGATVFILNQPRFDAKVLLQTLERCGVTTLCAPPTVWRLLIQENLSSYKLALREICGAGEPLNPEIIDQVREAWGLTIRDGYGQTETTAQIANPPGQKIKLGSMGRPLPGYKMKILDSEGQEAAEGEVCILLGEHRPAALMRGYEQPDGSFAGADDPVYRTGDVAIQDCEGYFTFVGRADDVFKSSGYRISPFELESVLIEHGAVAEAAVVPYPDPTKLAVPKAFVSLSPGFAPTRETALSLYQHLHAHLAPFKRIRRIEIVAELPKTISGKIRRVQLRALGFGQGLKAAPRGIEYTEESFPELRDRAP
ncbi:MAG: AMP-binding protein, partial [Acetobacteraceae bacterium]|nr:AMP-binding protein [Acetobacteraceae bacterium]